MPAPLPLEPFEKNSEQTCVFSLRKKLKDQISTAHTSNQPLRWLIGLQGSRLHLEIVQMCDVTMTPPSLKPSGGGGGTQKKAHWCL